MRIDGPREAGAALRRLLQQVAPHNATGATAGLPMPTASAAGSLYGEVCLFDFGTFDGTDLFDDNGVALVTFSVTTARWGTGFWDKDYFSA